MARRITVLGAGSIGVSTAMHLQQRGWQVTLIDRSKPATETSYGNAGVINASSFVPVNNPALFKKLPGMLFNSTPYVRYKFQHAVKNSPWIFHFLNSARKQSTIVSAEALAKLTAPALDEHRAFMQRVGNMHRLAEKGWLKVFRKGGGYDRNAFDGQLYDRFNITIQSLTAGEIQDMEPSLSHIYRAGYLIKDSAQVNNPGELIKEYAAQFVADGGQLLEQDVIGLRCLNGGDGKFVLDMGQTKHETEKLVIAAGPWSGDVLGFLGYRVMLGFERGYHQHFHFAYGASLSRPVHDVDSAFVVVPMEQGARVTTGVELNHRDAPSDYTQLKAAIPKAREAIALGEPTDDPIWRGCRPSFPDSRPVIDQAPRHKNLWLAFGHQHIGLMTGPITGKLISQMISGESTDIDIAPFNASRWIKSR